MYACTIRSPPPLLNLTPSESSNLFTIMTKSVRRRPRDLRRGRLGPRQERRLLLDLLLPWDARVPVQAEGGEDVEDDEGPHDAEVAPAGRVLRAELRQVDVGAGGGAELAVGGGVVVGEVAAEGVDVGGHVLAAGLAGGGVEVQVFDGRADDGVVGEAGG